MEGKEVEEEGEGEGVERMVVPRREPRVGVVRM